nr:MAG TPA: hypothetical protein [Caudoviricetes sp.]
MGFCFFLFLHFFSPVVWSTAGQLLFKEISCR